MSSYIMHMCVSQKVKEKLGLTDKFIYGSVLPDIIKSVTGDRDGTHYIEIVHIDGEIRCLPKINTAINELNIKDKEIRLGYIAHLIEDYIWFNEYIPSYAKKINEEQVRYLFDDSVHTNEEFRDVMYSDYSNCNKYIANKYNVDFNQLLGKILEQIVDKKEKQIVLECTKCLENQDITKNMFMTKESIDSYINRCTEIVEKEIKKILEE